MNRQLDMPPLTEQERNRLREINFYFLIHHIFKVFGNRLSAYEMFDAIAGRLQIHTTAVRALLNEYLQKNGPTSVAPTIYEICILQYKSGTPVSLIAKRIGKITPKTIYSYIQDYLKKNENTDTPDMFHPKLNKSMELTLSLLYPFLRDLCALEVTAYDAD